MTDDPLKEIRIIATRLYEQFVIDDKRFDKANDDAKKIVDTLGKVRDDKNIDANMRWLTGSLSVSECRMMYVYSSYMSSLNALTRLSVMVYEALNKITADLLQLKQQSIAPASNANLEKIAEIEKQLTHLNKEFRKYGPTLRKFKLALDETEEILRKNR